MNLDFYPPVGFHFMVTFKLLKSPEGVEGERESRFQEVTGLGKELGLEEYREGGENRYAHKLPTHAKYPNLILKRGVLFNSKVVKWCFDAIDHFDFQPSDLTILLLDENHKTLMRWEVVGAYPIKWSTTDLKAQDNSLVIESLELAYRYFIKKDEGSASPTPNA